MNHNHPHPHHLSNATLPSASVDVLGLFPSGAGAELSSIPLHPHPSVIVHASQRRRDEEVEEAEGEEEGGMKMRRRGRKKKRMMMMREEDEEDGEEEEGMDGGDEREEVEEEERGRAKRRRRAGNGMPEATGVRKFISPFAPEATIPLPHELEMSAHGTTVWKRNERERQRVRNLNDGYTQLRERLPLIDRDKRMSKVDSLRLAIAYIRHLELLLNRGPAHCAECACFRRSYGGGDGSDEPED